MAFLGSLPDLGSTPARRVTAPAWPGRAAAAVSVVALALLFWRPGTAALIVGYAFGAVVCPVLAVTHRFITEDRRKDPWYVRTSRPGQLLLIATGAGLLIGFAHAWLLATELAKI